MPSRYLSHTNGNHANYLQYLHYLHQAQIELKI
jgi:hypothetical protein